MPTVMSDALLSLLPVRLRPARIRRAAGIAGGAQSALDAAAHSGGGAIPVATRFKAWWHGLPIDDLAGGAGGPAAAPALQLLPDAVPMPVEVGTGAGEDAGFCAADESMEGSWWTPQRIHIAELLWGEGETLPGGSARTLDMIQAFGLGREVNVLNMGAGLGGTAQRVAAEYDGWVSGFEADPSLAAAAMARARKAGVAKKAEVVAADLDRAVIKSNVFDCAFAREALCAVDDKTAALGGIQRGLKENCPVLLTDFVLAGDQGGAQELLQWRAVEPGPVFPVTAEAEAELLRQLNFEMRVSEDITAQYRQDIFAGWEAFIAAHDATGIPGTIVQPMLDFAMLWAARVTAIDAGTLKVHKFVAIKK